MLRSIHTLFVLEDMYGLKIRKINEEICLNLGKSKIQATKLKRGEITKENRKKVSIKRPCRYSVSISENQQGSLYAIDVII